MYFITHSLVIATDSIHIEMGLPKLQYHEETYLIQRPQYWSNYSEKLGNPFWVSWNLNKQWFGDVERYSGNFMVDLLLPDGTKRVSHSDYTNSGYDRGHLVRSEERTATVVDNKSTFFMTNVIPQTPELNRNTWLDLERYLEKLCKDEDKELYIVAGAYYNENPVYLKEKVAIPDSCFKIAVVLNKNEGIEDVNENTRIIAVMMPNNQDVKNHEWQSFTRTIRSIENSTKINFLTNLSENLQEILENKTVSRVRNFNNSNSIQVFPNPAHNIINVVGANSYRVYDVYGNLILSSNDSNLDITKLSSGLYLIRGEGASTFFIKQ